MRVRIATTVGIATAVAGPVYTAFGGDHSAGSSDVVQAARVSKLK